jgi:hypothetical protein
MGHAGRDLIRRQSRAQRARQIKMTGWLPAHDLSSPAPHRVLFFADEAAAIAAGYRGRAQ